MLKEAKKINDVSEDKLIEYTDTMVCTYLTSYPYNVLPYYFVCKTKTDGHRQTWQNYKVPRLLLCFTEKKARALTFISASKARRNNNKSFYCFTKLTPFHFVHSSKCSTPIKMVDCSSPKWQSEFDALLKFQFMIPTL